MDPGVIVAIVAAVAAPLGAYLLAARRMSGKIGTSDAKELWSESRAIRDDYRDQLDTANRRTASLERRVAHLEEVNNNLTNDLATSGRENEALKGQVGGLKELVEQLRQTIDRLEGTIRKLEETVRSQREELDDEKEKA